MHPHVEAEAEESELEVKVPGFQPEMADYVKLLLRDAMYLRFHTDCLLKSID